MRTENGIFCFDKADDVKTEIDVGLEESSNNNFDVNSIKREEVTILPKNETEYKYHIKTENENWINKKKEDFDLDLKYEEIDIKPELQESVEEYM